MFISNNARLGREFRVGDSYIWSEIHYLDSTTDYREYLPQLVVGARKITHNDFVMLDSCRRSSRKHTFLAFAVVVMCLVAFWLLSYALLDW